MPSTGDPGPLRRASSRVRAAAGGIRVAAQLPEARGRGGPSKPEDDGEALIAVPSDDVLIDHAAIPRSVLTWFKLACMTVTLFGAYELLLVLGGVAGALLRVCLYVTFGGIIGFIAGPAVDRLERVARIPRSAAIMGVLLSGIAAFGLLCYLIAGAAFSEAAALARDVPEFIARGQTYVNRADGFLTQRGIALPSNDVLAGKAGELSATLSGLSKVTGVVIGGYVRAQLFMALILGSAAGIGCWLLGVPFPIVVAVTAGVFELIPLVGPFVGGAVAILLALTVSPNLAMLTFLLFLVLHLIEGYILGPRIQEKFIHLHPLIALLALLAGVEAAGFLGALFAVPACSLLAVFVRAAVGDWRANRPDLFAARDEDAFVEGRHRGLLREFRLFKRSP